MGLKREQTAGKKSFFYLCGSNRLPLHRNWNRELIASWQDPHFFWKWHFSVSSIHTRCCFAVKPLPTWEKTGGTRRTTTQSALLQVKANHSYALLGGFQLPRGKRGVVVRRATAADGAADVNISRKLQSDSCQHIQYMHAKKSHKSTPKSCKFTLKCKEA